MQGTSVTIQGLCSEWRYVNTSPSHHDPAIPVLSPVLFIHVGHPYIPHYKILLLQYKHIDKTGSINYYMQIMMETVKIKGERGRGMYVHTYLYPKLSKGEDISYIVAEVPQYKSSTQSQLNCQLYILCGVNN